MIAWALAFSLTVISGRAVGFRHGDRHEIHFDARLDRGLLGFGGRSYWGSLLNLFNSRFDFFLVGLYLNPAEVGLYAVAVYWPNSCGNSLSRSALFSSPGGAAVQRGGATFTPRVLRLLLPLLFLIALLIAISAG